jgi:hypothetical protein
MEYIIRQRFDGHSNGPVDCEFFAGPSGTGPLDALRSFKFETFNVEDFKGGMAPFGGVRAGATQGTDLLNANQCHATARREIALADGIDRLVGGLADLCIEPHTSASQQRSGRPARL